jgi:hypothetical protein
MLIKSFCSGRAGNTPRVQQDDRTPNEAFYDFIHRDCI